MSFGAYTLDASRNFMPSELAEAIAAATTDIDIRFVGGLSPNTAGFVDAARSLEWEHLTFFDTKDTGLVLTFERDVQNPEGAFELFVETEVDTDRFPDNPPRRALCGALAKRVIDSISGTLEMTVTDFQGDTQPSIP